MSADNAVPSFRASDYLQPLRRHWLAVLLCVILGIGGAVAYLHWAPKSYDAMAAVLVHQPSGSTTTQATTINLDTEAQLVTATGTAQAAAAKLHQPSSAASDLVSRVSVTVPPNSEILDIDYTGSSAEDAQKGALAFAQAYLDQRAASAKATLDNSNKALQTRIDVLNAQLQKVILAGAALTPNSPDRDRNNLQVAALTSQLTSLSTQQNQVQTTVVDPGSIQTQPVLPTSPTSPKRILVLPAGLILGLLVGVGVVALRNRSDDVIWRADDVARRTGVPVAAVLSGRLHDGDVAIQSASSSDGRGYARLRNLVTTALAQSDRRVVLVAGVLHGGGPVAANLAASLARAGEKTCLICADVFGSTASGLLDGSPQAGLAEVLAGEIELARALRSVPGVPGLQVLGPGQDPDKADALLQTSSALTLVERLLTSVSYVVVEAPATSESPDAQTLANTAEFAILVLEIGQVPGHDVVDACAQLESVGAPVLGAVVAQYSKKKNREKEAVAVTDEAPGPTAVVPVATKNRRLPPAATAATSPVEEAMVPHTGPGSD
jgi:Mrp family chromosome partitioning ATPase/capsular polysaccharide biosynthesis protein